MIIVVVLVDSFNAVIFMSTMLKYYMFGIIIHVHLLFFIVLCLRHCRLVVSSFLFACEDDSFLLSVFYYYSTGSDLNYLYMVLNFSLFVFP